VLLRIIIWCVLFYLAYKFIGNLFRSVFGVAGDEKVKVKGKAKKTSLDVDEDDIEDVDFEEIK
jgi:hypothetical protein